MPNNRTRRRKRNKSSPLVESSPKKTKNYQDFSESSEFQVVNSESDLEPESESQSQSLLQTPANRGVIDPATVTLPPSPSSPVAAQSILAQQTMQDPDFATPSQSLGFQGPGPVMGQDAYGPQSQSAMINPMYGSQLPTQMMGYQPTTLPISDHDLFKIAKLVSEQVKAMLQDEISEQVKLKVEDATKSLKTELDATKTELSNAKSVLENMQTHVDDLHDQVLNLQQKQDEAEQYSRRMCLRISGIPESTNENVTKKVLDFAKEVHSTMTLGDIDRAHRVGASAAASNSTGGATETKTREIIIKFTNSNARLNLLRGRAVLRDNNVKGIFISEDLTPARKKLAFECRRIKRLNGSKIKKVWIYAGYPHILDASNKKVRITCIEDLKDYDVKEPGQPGQPTSS